MAITLKPLTAFVVLNNNNSASIIVKNPEGDIVLGPLTHYDLSTKENPATPLNDHIEQLISRGMNIVSIQSTMEGIVLK